MRFDEVVPGFWADGDHGVQPPLTDETLREAQRALGVRLPDRLVELLRVRNGGSVAPEFDAFPVAATTLWGADHVPVAELMGIGRREQTLSLFDSPYLTEEWRLPSQVVLISGEGHYWIGLDYRKSGPQGEPAVTWFEPGSGTELLLAPDFLAFVEGLTAADSFEDLDED